MLRRRGKYWSKCGLSKCLDDLRSIVVGLIISLFSPKQLINSLSQDQDYVYCWGVLILLFDIAGIGRESVMVPLMWLNHICTQLVLSCDEFCARLGDWNQVLIYKEGLHHAHCALWFFVCLGKVFCCVFVFFVTSSWMNFVVSVLVCSHYWITFILLFASVYLFWKSLNL